MRKFIIFMLTLVVSKLNAFTANELLTEAQSSFLNGDLYNASRFYAYVLVKDEKITKTTDIENYIISNHHISNSQEIKKICSQNMSRNYLKNDFAFYCGKTFMYLGDYVTSIEFLEKIPKELHRLEYHFIKSTAYLKLNKTNQCIEEMNKAKTKTTKLTSQRFKDAMSILHARCYLGQGLYQKALEQFQNINVNSEYYFSTIEEQAWAHFKQRNLITARDLLKIILNYFSSQGRVTSTFGADVYFRVRYLQGYIELITKNADISKQIFSSINLEIKSYKEKVFSKVIVPKKFESSLALLKRISDLKNPEYKLVKEYRDFIKQWTDHQSVVNFDKDIRFIIALNIEIDRASNLNGKGLGDYKDKLLKLQRNQAKLMVLNVKNYLFQSQRNIDSILFKSNMGQVENIWAERTEGKRTLAEVLDTYKNEVSNVEDYFTK